METSFPELKKPMEITGNLEDDLPVLSNYYSTYYKAIQKINGKKQNCIMKVSRKYGIIRSEIIKAFEFKTADRNYDLKLLSNLAERGHYEQLEYDGTFEDFFNKTYQEWLLHCQKMSEISKVYSQWKSEKNKMYGLKPHQFSMLIQSYLDPMEAASNKRVLDLVKILK